MHTGEVLLEEFLQPSAISRNALARAAGVPARRINETVVLGQRDVTADIALRPAASSERCWLGSQADYELEETHRALGKSVASSEPIAA